MVNRTMRTIGSRAIAPAMGRTSPAASHVDVSSSDTRLVRRRRRTMIATKMTAPMIGSTRLRPWFVPTATSRTPSAVAAAVIATRSTIPPSTSAARARSSRSKLSVESIGRPSTPARRNTATNASTAAADHTTVCSRFTGTPSSDARSALSALARTAMPTALTRSASASSAMTIGVTISAITALPSKITPFRPEPTVKCRSKGGSRWGDSSRGEPNNLGRRIAPAASSCVSPSVATVSRSRGDRKKRRMIASSTTAPTTTAATRPAVAAIRYGQCHTVSSKNTSTTGAVPRSPAAKLTIRFDRYVSAIPSAIRAVSPPTINPRSHKPGESGKRTSWTARIAAAGVSERASERHAGARRDAETASSLSAVTTVNGPP